MEKSANGTFPPSQPPRKEAVAGTDDPWKKEQKKDINQTRGGKFANWLIDWGIGFFGNAILSVYMTYYLNPQTPVKNFKKNVESGIVNSLNIQDEVKKESIVSGIRSGVEICFQFAAGFIATLVMTPLVSRREKIAHSINKMLGTDTDVLPSAMVKPDAPKTVEERIHQEINKRVNYKQTPGDLWMARIPATFAIFLGDQIYNLGNIKLEKNHFQSPDTLILRGGQQLYKLFPDASQKMNSWFEHHEAGMEDIKKNAPAHYQRLEAVETKYGHTTPESLNTDRMAIAEGTRIFAKEAGWTFAMADAVKEGTQYFHDKRVLKETANAIKILKRKGLIPEGYDVALTSEGKVVVSNAACAETPLATGTGKTQDASPAIQPGNADTPSTTLDLKDKAWVIGQLQPDATQTLHTRN